MTIKDRWLEVHAKMADWYYELRPRKRYKTDGRGILTRLKKRIEAFKARRPDEDAIVIQVDRTVEQCKDITPIPTEHRDKLEAQFVDGRGNICVLSTLYVTEYADFEELHSRLKKHILTHSQNRRHTRTPKQTYRIVRSLLTIHTQDVEIFEINYTHTELNLENKTNEKSI